MLYIYIYKDEVEKDKENEFDLKINEHQTTDVVLKNL